ncbi:MAG: chemotaxis protein CheW [Syntrophobacteraceae bacterium]
MADHNGTVDEQQMLVSTFFLGDAAFGIDTEQVQEVVRVGDITAVHHAPQYVLGVMNLRGRIATVIDLGIKLDLAQTGIGPDSRIFIVEWEGEQVGLLVDRVADAIAVDRTDLKPPPENVRSLQGHQFKGVCSVEGRLVALLDMAAVLDVEGGTESGSARSE